MTAAGRGGCSSDLADGCECACQPVARMCVDNLACCSGNCDGAMCLPCKGRGASCVANSPCCSYVCRGGLCN